MNRYFHFARFYVVTLFLFCGLLTAPNSSHAQPAQPQNPLIFRTLLVIKPVGDIHSERHLKVQYQMTPEDIRVITTAFQNDVPYWINRITRGRIQWQADVRVSPVPLRTIHVWDDGCGLAPEDISEDIDAYAPQGKYDAVFVYWKSWDDETNYRLPGPYGWASGTFESANYAGFASVQYDVPSAWTRESGSTEVFIHEWLHLMEGFYGGREGVQLARGGLHAGEEHSYTLNERNWKDWYGDLLNGEIREGNQNVGLGEVAWKYGTMREAAALKPAAGPRAPGPAASASKIANDDIRTSPEYLTPARRARNLLRNGDFRGGDDGAWEIQSFRNNKNAATLIPDTPEPGDVALQISTSQPDDVKLVQKVAVKKRANYLLTGWIATDGVRIVEQNGRFGASIGTVNGAERTPPMLGNQKWRYVATGFYTGESTEIEICARLGGIASTAIGAARFHDLCLIEVVD